MRPQPGSMLADRYSVSRVLGQGSMATAYLALDTLWHTEVVLKLLRVPSPALLRALRFEFDALRCLSHPNLTRVHDLVALAPSPQSGEPLCFYTCDRIDGHSLDAAAEGLGWPPFVDMLCGVLQALGVLHHLGIRHGDVKPSNVLVGADHRAVLIDLGCARPIGESAESGAYGTPAFWAPELLAGQRADHRADLFALGKLIEQLAPHLRGSMPSALRSVLDRLLQPRPEHRPGDADEVLEALGAEPAARPPAVRRHGVLAGRSAERAVAASHVQAMLEGHEQARVLWISGPEGIGRSRLLREIKWDAQLCCRVVEGNASAPNAIGAMLASALGKPVAAGDVAAALGALDEMQMLHEPVVFVLDDVHRLDEAESIALSAWLRTRADSDRFLLVATSIHPPPVSRAGVEELPLAPLTRAAVEDWLGDGVLSLQIDQILRSTGGYPSAINSMLDAFARGELTESGLAAWEGVNLSERRVAAAAALPQGPREALAAVLLLDGVLTPEQRSALGISESHLGLLQSVGFVERDGAVWRLVRAGERGFEEVLLGPDALRLLHRKLAALFASEAGRDDIGPDHRSERLARLTLHTAGAGDIDGALRMMAENSALATGAPRAWVRSAQVVARLDARASTQRACASIERLGGEATSALKRLRGLLDERHATEPGLHHELGMCLLEMGDVPGAVQELEVALSLRPQTEALARVRYELARCHVRRGAYREAIEHVDRALEHAVSPPLRADLHQTAAVACGCLGELPAARDHLAHASEVLADLGDPRRLVRSHGSRALIEYRGGRLSEAAEGYRLALRVAEQHGLADQLATAALNVGTLAHQRAEYASALSSYERGMRMAAALGQTSTETVLRFNLAKLYADLGLFDRAARAAERCIQVATHNAHLAMAAAATTVLGEVAIAQGRLVEARERLTSARAQFIATGAEREVGEIEIHLAEAALATGDVDEAERWLEQAARRPGASEPPDVRLKLDLARARACLLRGRPAEALPIAERATRSAGELRQWDAEGEAQMVLASIWRAQGATLLVRKHQARAAEVWEAACAGLPDATREAFWMHPRRRDLPRVEAEPAPLTTSRREKKLELLVDINKRLNSSLDTQQVLTRAMDAAIELTGAERGFVLLTSRRRSGLHVAVARNLDREQLGRSHLKFSRAIAEQVVESGEAVVTANATDDQRFRANRSVHAMQLQSVVCVPVVSPRGILGALYLDNRFRRGRFGSEDVDLLMAFADQAALALHNARLHAELQERNRELEQERRRVEALAQGQAAEIDRLSAAIQSSRKSRARRYDYSAIIGDSPAMHAVFDVLDRVIDTNLPVLIQGESGTGKELVARAIHHNGPRSSAPLVAVNCGAVPEALLESELFGHVRGAFTGADRDREGLIARARGGTLFLDELGELPLTMQVKLLRVLQDHEVRPLGGTKSIPVDFRLVCATNRNLSEDVRRGTFREDLFYRVSVIDVVLPPLRDRTDDIPTLAQHLVALAAERTGRAPPALTRQALRKLADFSWPGNVRQLQNVLTRANVLAVGDRLGASDIELPDRAAPANALSREDFERREMQTIADALAKLRWNVAEVARTLGIPRPTLYRKLQRYGLVRSRRSPG